MTEDYPQTELWRFMLRVYAAPGVATTCLRLQDRDGVDVPLLLAALYAATQGCRVGPEEVRGLDRVGADWRNAVIHPLRAIRRRIKQSDWMQTLEPVPDFREDVKWLELRGEGIQTLMLGQAIDDLPRGVAGPGPDGAACRSAARAVVAHATGAAALAKDALADIEIVVAAAIAPAER